MGDNCLLPSSLSFTKVCSDLGINREQSSMLSSSWQYLLLCFKYIRISSLVGYHIT